MRGFDHATISYSQFPRSPLGTPGTMTPFCVLNKTKNALQIMSLAVYASETYKAGKNNRREKSYAVLIST